MVKTNNFKSPFQATAAKFQSNLNNFVEILSQLIRFYVLLPFRYWILKAIKNHKGLKDGKSKIVCEG